MRQRLLAKNLLTEAELIEFARSTLNSNRMTLLELRRIATESAHLAAMILLQLINSQCSQGPEQ